VTHTDRIYLDHGATAVPKAPVVAAAMTTFLEHDAGNPGRGGHRLTVAASRAIEGAREEAATLLGSDPERTLFGSGATFWLNTVLSSWLEPGDRVVVSSVEHNAVMRPLRHMESEREVEVIVATGSDPCGVPEVDEMTRLVGDHTPRCIVLSHASNVTGAVAPVEEIARAVAPVPILVDGAQTAGSIPFRFPDLGVAAYVCSGHKGLLGPPGTGMLLLGEDVSVEPMVRGGTGSASESEEMPGWLPDGLEPGTPNGPGIAGVGAACAWIAGRTVESIHEHVDHLVRRVAHELLELPGVTLWGWDEATPRTGILSFTIDGLDCGELGGWLDRERGLMLRAGLHCSPAAHRRLGSFPDGTVRAGFGPFNSAADGDALMAAVRDAARGGLR
jgi:selenocysteine lyase/cysteine desulfurase